MKLDVGCGRDKKKGYVGVDIESFEGVDIVASADALPFRTGAFESVFTQECVIEAEYTGNEAVACYELARVLGKGGTLTFNCWKGEPFLKLIPLHRRREVGTYRPRWWLLDRVTQGEVLPTTFKSYTLY